MITPRSRIPMSMAAMLAWGAILSTLAPLCVRADSAQARSRPYVGHCYASLVPKDRAQVEAIWTSAAAILEPHDPAIVEHHVAIRPEALRALEAAGIQARVLDDDVQHLVDESYERMLTPSRAAYSGALPEWFDEVRPLTEVYTYLDQLAKDAAGRATVRVIGKANKNDIKVIRISSAASDEGRGSVLITGTHHAREWISPMVVMGYVWSLTSQYDSDPAVKKIVDNLNVYIVPVQNPDSYILTFSGERLRRTNTSPSCEAGVDLNRNWDAKDWGKTNFGVCGTETYCGPNADSEPETKVTRALGESLTKPLLYIDVHSGGDVIMTPYAANRTVAKMYEQAKAAADVYGKIADLRVEPGIVLAQGAGGGALDFFQESWDAKQGITFVVELPPGPGRSTFDIPSDGIPANVDRNAKALTAVLEKLADANPAPVGNAGMGAAGMGGASGAAGTGAAGVSGGAGQGAAGVAGSSTMVGAAGTVAGAAGETAVAGSAGPSTQVATPATGSAGVHSMTVGITAAPSAGNAGVTGGSLTVVGTAGQIAQPGVPRAQAESSESGCSSSSLGSRHARGKHAWALITFLFALRYGWSKRRTRVAA
jgi:carboxypeptidase A2